MLYHLTELWNGGPLPAGQGGRAALERDGGLLAFSWDLALPAEPRIPNEPAGFLDGLWEHDVVELFLGARGSGCPYLELEFGPGGHWLALTFSAARQRTGLATELEPELRHELEPGRWRGRAALPLALVERHVGAPPWKGLVAAVVGGDGVHACWPRLPGPTADFHQPAHWARFLPSPGAAGL